MAENTEARDKLAARLFNAYEQSQGRSPAFGLFVERERSAWQAVADEALRAAAESLVSGDECGALCRSKITGENESRCDCHSEDDEDVDPEPPFSENHHRYHTPAGPNPSCPNCRWMTWSQPDE